ncbi:MAG TPA: hypothetical protein VKA30_13230, partial [Actinomycetota bacterium]|nr:hypothetical protein [Actinomycetota bacterium]
VAVLALLLVGGVVYAATSLPGGDSSAGPSARPTTLPGDRPNLPPCDEPKRIASPAWVPKDLPLPAGTYPYNDLGETNGYHRALFVVHQDLTALAQFLLTKWPAAGWILGRGDAEAGEIETGFSKPPAVGAIRARTVFCTPGYTALLLVYTANRAAVPVPTPSIGGSGTPLGPVPSPRASG